MRTSVLETYFPKRLFDFLIIYRHSASKAVSPVPPTYQCRFRSEQFELWTAGPTIYQAIDGREDQYRCVLGDLFQSPSSTGENLDGHYIAVAYCLQSKRLEVSRNLNSHIGINYATLGDTSYIFGDLFRGFKWLAPVYKLDFSERAEQEFLECGIVSFGRTLFEEIKRVPFRKMLNIEPAAIELSDEDSLELHPDAIDSSEKFFTLVQERFHKWLIYANFRSVALSGGIDSRFILALLAQIQPKTDLRLYSRCHPYLNLANDRDIIAASKLAQLVNYPYLLQRAANYPTFYFSQEPPAEPPIMSGLLGGEYLGGEIFEHVQPGQTLAEKIQIFASASISEIYGGAWLAMAAHSNLTLTPFWDSYVLEAILKMPDAKIRGYRLYYDLYESLPSEFRAIPLNSHINMYYPEMASLNEGEDPKEANQRTPLSRAEILEAFKKTIQLWD